MTVTLILVWVRERKRFRLTLFDCIVFPLLLFPLIVVPYHMANQAEQPPFPRQREPGQWETGLRPQNFLIVSAILANCD